MAAEQQPIKRTRGKAKPKTGIAMEIMQEFCDLEPELGFRLDHLNPLDKRRNKENKKDKIRIILNGLETKKIIKVEELIQTGRGRNMIRQLLALLSKTKAANFYTQYQDLFLEQQIILPHY